MIARGVLGFLAGGTLFALSLLLVGQDRSLTLVLAGTSAGLFVLAGLSSMGLRMPPLPALAVSTPPPMEEQMRLALAGDTLARVSVLETLEASGELETDRTHRDQVLELPPHQFEPWLRREIQRLEEVA
jgi:hypothetical protein